MNPNSIQYDSFMNVTDNMTVFMMDSLETNFGNIISRNVGSDTITFSFEANTTVASLSFAAVDHMVSNMMHLYLRVELSRNAIGSVSCIHHPQYNESYSNAPTPEPTYHPTLHPTERHPVYEDIYIPIEEVSLASAEELVLAIQTAPDTMHISFSCETSSPTQPPSTAPTQHIVERNETLGDTGEEVQLVIFGYETGQTPSAALTFPEVNFLTFHNVYTLSCEWKLDSISSSHYSSYLISIDTIYSSVDELCIRYNNKNIVLQTDTKVLETDSDGLYEWTATESTGANCSNSVHRTSIVGFDRGSYCFAAYQLKDDTETYHFRIQKRFKWTTPYIHITNTVFSNNVCSDGKGGAVAIISEDGVDEWFSAKISYSNFTENYAMYGGGSIHREYSFAEMEYHQSVYMSVLELEYVNINESMVHFGAGGSIKTDLSSILRSDGLYFKYVLSITNSVIGHSTTAANQSSVALLRSMNRRRLLSLQNDVGNPDDGYGGVLHFEYGNVFLANSVIEFGKAYRGGGIFLFDTAIQLLNTQILGNVASGDGGGIYQSLYTQYGSYDLCVSIYGSIFADNAAGGLGGAIYSALHGKDSEHRQSCFKIINGTFLFNGNVSVYVNVTSGAHKVLRNQGALYTFCPDTDECSDFRSVLSHLCVAEIASDCNGWTPGDPNPLDTVSDIPGASIVLYVYGWDAFGNKMLNTEYGITASASGAQVINPHGTQSTADDNQYIVPLVVSTGSKETEAEIIVEDTQGGAEAITIQLQITDCEPGYHQQQVGNTSLFSCKKCEVNKYTMATSECRDCPEYGANCLGGNLLYIKENWYAKVGVDSCLNDPDNSYIATTLCPPGYCCNQKQCRFPNAFDYTLKEDIEDPNYLECINQTSGYRRRRLVEALQAYNDTSEDEESYDEDDIFWVNSSRTALCAANRDPSVPMCGSCLPGYYETLSSSGNCAKCHEKGMSNEGIIPLGVFICFGLVFWFFRNGRKLKKDVPHPFMTYLSKTLLFFYQVLTFLTFRSSVQVIKPLAEMLNFNIDFSGDGSGTCLLKRVTSRQKLWLNLLTPAIIMFDLIVLLSGISVNHHLYKKKKGIYDDKQWHDDFLAMQGAFWNIFMIIYVQFTSAFIKLSICYPFGDKWYMWYAGDVRCTWKNGALVMCNIMAGILIVVAPVFIWRVMARYKRKHERKYRQIFAPLILSYQERCCYYTPFNVFRRAILIVLPSVPTNELSVRASLSTFAMGSIICIHCYLMPFRYSISNHLETFVLMCGFFIATLNITDSPPDWFPKAIAFLAIIPLVPLPFLFHDFSIVKKKTATKNIQVIIDPDEQQLQQQMIQLPPPAPVETSSHVIKHANTLDTPEVIEPLLTSVSIAGESDSTDSFVGRTSHLIKEEQAQNIEDKKWTFRIGRKSIVVVKRAGTLEETEDDDAIDMKQEERTEQKGVDVRHHYGEDYDFLPGTLPHWVRSKFGFAERELDEYQPVNLYNDEPEFQDSKDKEKEIELPTDLLDIGWDPGTLYFTKSMVSMEHGDDDDQSTETKTKEDVRELEELYSDHLGTESIHSDTMKAVDAFMDQDETKEVHGTPPAPPKLSSISLADMQISASGDVLGIQRLIGSIVPKFGQSKKKEILTMNYNVIKLKQKGWRHVDDEAVKDTESKPYEFDADTKQQETTPFTKMATELDQMYSEDPKRLMADITGDEYYVPKGYLYMNGTYGPSQIDPTFQSVTYCHNESKWLELRVASVLQDGEHRNQLLVTWNLADMKHLKVFYQAKGTSLLIPPTSGWRRLMDEEAIQSRQNAINIDIIAKELEPFPGPEIINLTADKDSCISIQYDYKKLAIPDAPHMKQWIEVRAYKQTENGDDNVVFATEIINLVDGDDERKQVIDKHDDEKEWSTLTDTARKIEELVDDDELVLFEEDEDDETMVLLDNDDDSDRDQRPVDMEDLKVKISHEIYEKPTHKNVPSTEFQEMMTNILMQKAGLKLQKTEWVRDTYCFENLELGHAYKFMLKLSNTIGHSESDLSESIIPKTKPVIGTIGQITSDPDSQILRIHPIFPAKAYNNPSMQPIELFIKISPWPGADAFVMLNDDLYELMAKQRRIQIKHKPISTEDNHVTFEPLIASNIKLGTEYSVWVESENDIGKKGSRQKAYKYIPCRKPPKPIIQKVNTDVDDCAMTIYFVAKGFNDKNCRAWFQLELIDPNLYLNDDDTKEPTESKEDITPRTLHKEISHILSARHEASPIILSPLFVGQEYNIRIQCVNNQGISYSDAYEPIIFRKPPPTPEWDIYRALDSQVMLKFKCPNYNFRSGYHPEYEIQAAPHHTHPVVTTRSAVKIDYLRNGWVYNFKVRATNEFGVSNWSKNVQLTPLKKPYAPTNLHLVSGDRCISVFWFSLDDKMGDSHVNGRFVIISDPPTKEKQTKKKHKVEFQALDNDQFYRFKVSAINANFESASEWSVPVKPSANKDASIYDQEKNLAIEQILKLRRIKIRELKRMQQETTKRKREQDIERIKRAQKEKKEMEMAAKLKEIAQIRKGTVEDAKKKIQEK